MSLVRQILCDTYHGYEKSMNYVQSCVRNQKFVAFCSKTGRCVHSFNDTVYIKLYFCKSRQPMTSIFPGHIFFD